jgi:hypothetical protein
MLKDEKQQAQFEQGLRNIAEGVIGGLAKIGITLKRNNIDWSAWRLGQPIPLQPLQIIFRPDGFQPMQFPFLREQIADSWDGLERPDVRNLVRRIVKNYKDVQGETGNA